MRMPVTLSPTGACRRFLPLASGLQGVVSGCAAIGLVAAFGASAAYAQSTPTGSDPQWSLIPTVGWVLTDSNRRAANGLTYGLSLSRVIATDWDLALRGNWEKLGAETGGPGRYSNWAISADSHWYFAGRQGVGLLGGGQPYAIAGLGVINERVPGSTETNWMAHAGLGTDWGMGQWGRLQLDARYRLDANSSQFGGGGKLGDWIIGLGWRIPLGSAVQPSVPARVMSPPPAPPVSPALIRPAPSR